MNAATTLACELLRLPIVQPAPQSPPNQVANPSSPPARTGVSPTMQAAPPNTPNSWWNNAHLNWGLLIPALVLVVIGVWLLKGKGDALEEQRRVRRVNALSGVEPKGGLFTRLHAWKLGLAEPTRLVFGLASAIVGYHVAAWVLPDKWSPMHVPFEKWWMLGLFVVIGVVGTVWVDRREAVQTGGSSNT